MSNVSNMQTSVTCIAPINIAVIKYWGKENEDYNIPLNSSISVTLDPSDLCSQTTASVDEKYTEDLMWLNGEEQLIQKNKRLQRCINEVRKLSKQQSDEIRISSLKCHIASSNNFPTAAGLASSAAGYACLVKCLGTVYNIDTDLSKIARLGSGSACRSIDGGFVKWEKGSCPFGTDSRAIQISPEQHWPELKVIILVVNNKQKAVGSTEGMKRSVNTSDLLKYRAETCVMGRLKKMEEAILAKDFQAFSTLTMKDSNQLHAICQDTYPPINYMNYISHQIVKCITMYNAETIKAGYTFDAGSNAVIFTLDKYFDELLATILKYFPFSDNGKGIINLPSSKIKDITKQALSLNDMEINEDGLQRIICTKPGPGSSIISNDDSLLNFNGLPK